MRALSILQPWPTAILSTVDPKDIENRDWKDGNPGLRFRGEFLIHTGQGFDRDGYEHLRDLWGPARDWPLPPPADMFRRGGIIGIATITGAVKSHPSKWFFGRWGLILTDARPTKFVPMKGMLGFFNVPYEIVREVLAA